MRLVVFAVCFLFSLCVFASQSPDIKKLAQAYFSQYQKRNDFDAFMSMYSPDAVLLDINYGNYVTGRDAIRAFLQWDAGNVELLESTTLDLDDLLIDGKQVVARGHFNKFTYQNTEMGPWLFVIWLEFDEQGKIIRQTDWINYTPKQDFTQGEDMNTLIK